MYGGIAAGLLAFTGVWHATEWLMDGPRRDTLLLVPAGVFYAVMGYMIALSIGGNTAMLVTLVATTLGGAFAWLRRDAFDVRAWVLRAFILVDVVIVGALALALLG